MISETIDDPFWIGQFLFDVFSATLRQDRDRNGGGNIPFIMTPSLNLQSLNLQVECFYIQLNPCAKTWLLSYKGYMAIKFLKRFIDIYKHVLNKHAS